MDDRELLELAAKAAGVEHEGVVDEGACIFNQDLSWSRYWNPLTDDGDALRLAVKTGLVVGSGSLVYVDNNDLMAAWAAEDGTHEMKGYSQERFSKSSGDALAATRRAIVRAAAAIGRSMKATPTTAPAT